jgi:hypothetical protein
VNAVEHRVVHTELLNSLTLAVRLTCACGWEGHGTRWLDHSPDAQPLPTEPRRPISKRDLHVALYGSRHRCSRCR